MPEVAVVNSEGVEVSKITLSDGVFGVEPSMALVHSAVVAHLANVRAGSAATLTRANVRGGGRKPFRQKGTGRARQGSIRAPHMPGGGVVWGPHPKDYNMDMPKKMRRQAMKSALSAKLADGQVKIVDEIKMDAISTKKLVATMDALGVEGKTVLILAEHNDTIYRSARNVPWLMVRVAPGISTYELLNAATVLMVKDAVAKMEEVHAK